MNLSIKTIVTAAVLGFTASTGYASAQTLVVSNWLPATYPQSKYGHAETFERVRERTNGGLEFDVHYSGALLPARTTLQGVRDGVADVGIVFPGYSPAELPIADLLNSASFNSNDPLAAALAYTEMNATNPKLQEEWSKFDTVFGGAYATPTYLFMCNTEVSSLQQARGKRMRTAGGSFTALAGSLGGTAVSVPIGDVYSGMQRGSLDCILADPTNLVVASFNEVVTDITEIPLGLVPGATWVYNKKAWQRLADEQRTVLLEEMWVGIVRQQVEFAKLANDALADARARGISLHQPATDLSDHVNDFRGKFIQDVVAGIDRNIISEPEALLEEYFALQDTWAEFLDSVDRSDEAAVIAAVKERFLQKVDPSTFGM